MAVRPRSSPHARAAVARLPLPAAPRGLLALAGRLAPSWRSLLVGVLLLIGAGGTYLAARETSLFAVQQIEIRGASPRVAAEVRRALGPLAGTSLLKLSGTDVERRLIGLPTVAAASYDRAFPHTLRVYVRAEQPLAVLRRGSVGWLVSASGRVMRDLPHPRLSSLPRIWLAPSASVSVGAVLADEHGRKAVNALAELRSIRLGSSPRDIVTGDRGVSLLLRTGIEIRLGEGSNLRLKLAVARRILPLLSPPGYLDVSVPERAVAGVNSQLEG
jgi:cell division septal protein FtsQ